MAKEGRFISESKDKESSQNVALLASSCTPSRIYFPRTSQVLLNVRKRLGHLTQIAEPVSVEAVALARSMSLVLNQLFPLGGGLVDEDLKNGFQWSINTIMQGRGSSDASLGPLLGSPQMGGFLRHDNILFKAQHDGEEWNVSPTDFDAILSLCISAYVAKTPVSCGDTYQTHLGGLSLSKNSRIRHTKLLGVAIDPSIHGAEDSIREDSDILAERKLRTNTLLRDLNWWTNDPRILNLNQIRDTGIISNITTSRGPQDQMIEVLVEFYGLSATSGLAKAAEHDFTTTPNHRPDNYGVPLSIVSVDSLTAVLSFHLLSAFIWAISPLISTETFSESTVEDADRFEVSQFASTWNLLTLRNKLLSKLVYEIAETGVATIEDVLLCIIPPFSVRGLLPNNDVLRVLLDRVQDAEKDHDWMQVKDIYLNLLKLDLNPSKQDRLCYAVLAELIEFLFFTLEVISDRGGLTDTGQSSIGIESQSLQVAADEILEALAFNDSLVFAIRKLAWFYFQQGRERQFLNVLEALRLVSAPDPENTTVKPDRT
jgi:hypothetical protein